MSWMASATMPFPPPPPPSGHPPPPHGPHKRLGGDPYLQYQPHFAFSLPVQILCNGMILTLAGVLLIHLVLTAQYHWALARVNYLFQLSAICMLCINVIASTIVVFATVHSDSRTWPYMLDYIAVTVPVNSWSLTEKILWYTLEAVTSGLAHITHIQFLTLMYPSKLEARLIFILLGPLAVASSAMQYCSLSPHQTAQDLGDAIRGICNTTLALLFTAALFIWGFIVNRKRAWRTDGGTAVFGASAIILAIMSIVINFILVFMDEMLWLPSLLWAVVMWQTFLGWWWWVGAGMSIGEVEDMLEREQKRKDERRRKKIKQLQKQDARGTGSARFMSAIVPGSLTRRQRSATAQTATNGSASIHSSENGRNHESIELSVMGSTHTTNNAAPGDELDDSPSVVAVPTALRYIPLAPTLYTSALRGWRSLTRAHRDEVINVAMSRPAQAQEGTGWGLGDYGLREREEAEQRIRDFQAERRRRMLLGEDLSLAEQDEVERDIASGDDDDDDDENGRGFFYPPPPPAFHSASGAPSPHSSIPLQPMPGPSEERAEAEATDDPLPHPLPPNDSLFWRWGPLRKWRLQDRTTY